jgi:hypothetical protein
VSEHGAIAPERVEAFARNWLAVTGGDLALRVLDGGEFIAARFVELCKHVLHSTVEPAGRSAGSGS